VIRVLVVDDHGVVRAGLDQLLSATPGVEVVGRATDGLDAVDQAGALQPDVVLMDLSMPVLDGVEATRRIVAAGGPSRVVILTSFSDQDRVLAAIDAGARGYVLKDAEPDELVRAIRAAAVGDVPLDPKAARALVSARTAVAGDGDPDGWGAPTPSGPGGGLTPREHEVLDLVRSGLANKQIARELGISEKTVKAHLTRIFQELGVNDRTQAALWAQRQLG
jgi:DNA-binding NarL/FixJ family response regulator